MGLQSGTLALRKHHILGTLGSWEAIRKQLCAFAQKPIGVEDPTEESFGWCHPFTGEPYGPGTADAQWGSSWVLGVRWDTKRVPATFLRLELQQAFSQLPAQSQNRKAREQLKEGLKQQLLAKSLPSVRVVECILQVDRQQFWVLTPSVKTLATIQHLFRETFHMDLVELTPGTAHLPWEGASLGQVVDETMDAMPLGLNWSRLRDRRAPRAGAEATELAAPDPAGAADPRPEGGAPF